MKKIIFIIFLFHLDLSAKLRMESLTVKSLENTIINQVGNLKVQPIKFYLDIELSDGFATKIDLDNKIVDLGQIIPKRKGRATIKFITKDIDIESADEVSIYYLSFLRSKRMLKKKIGLGCNKYIKINKIMSKKLLDMGVHISQSLSSNVLAGKYYILIKKDDQVYFALLTLVDSNKPVERCSWVKKMEREQ